MSQLILWNGSSTEMQDLLDAVSRNCTCKVDGQIRTPPCGSCLLLLSQRSLDDLLCNRRRHAGLQAEEWSGHAL
jgi:hypothetical protein